MSKSFGIAGATLVASAALFAPACSSHEAPPPTTVAVDMPDTPPLDSYLETADENAFQQAAQEGRVAVDILIAPIEGSTLREGAQRIMYRTLREAQSGALANRLETSMEVATSGRLTVDATVRLLPEQTVPGHCVDSENTEQVYAFEDIADRHGSPNQADVELLIGGLPGCRERLDDGDQLINQGYTDVAEQVTVLAADGRSQMLHNEIHELGHQLGVGHNGLLDCDRPTRPLGCADDMPTAGSSVMAYNVYSDKFNSAELMIAGLLEPRETRRIDNPGDYIVGAMTPDPSEQAKVLTYRIPDGRQLLISYEEDLNAGETYRCAYTDGPNTLENPLLTAANEHGEFGCNPALPVYGDHSVIVRIRENNRSTDTSDIALLPMVDPEFDIDFLQPDGYGRPDDVIYRDGSVVMTIEPQGDQSIIHVIPVQR